MAKKQKLHTTTTIVHCATRQSSQTAPTTYYVAAIFSVNYQHPFEIAATYECLSRLIAAN